MSTATHFILMLTALQTAQTLVIKLWTVYTFVYNWKMVMDEMASGTSTVREGIDYENLRSSSHRRLYLHLETFAHHSRILHNSTRRGAD